MDIKVSGRKTTVTDALRAHVDEKIGEALKVFDIEPMTVDVVLRYEKNPSNPNPAIVEVTVRARGSVIRVAEHGADIEIDRWMDEDPVPMNPELVAKIEQVAKDSGANYRMMHSGAGHDSQVIAPHVPTGMLFVPSVKGISPEEVFRQTVQNAKAVYQL